MKDLGHALSVLGRVGGLLVYSLHEGFRACSKCFGSGWGAAGLLPS